MLDAACVDIAWALCLSTLSNAWCCLCGHCLSLVFKNRTKSPLIKKWHKRKPEYTHEHLKVDLVLKWAKRQFFVRFDGPSCDGTLKPVIPTTAKEILTWEKQSLTVSVYPLRYAVWPLDIIWWPDIRKVTSQSIYWNYCAGAVLIAGQTECRVMNTAQYCPQTIHYTV
jgi:hypothetical protein